MYECNGVIAHDDDDDDCNVDKTKAFIDYTVTISSQFCWKKMAEMVAVLSFFPALAYVQKNKVYEAMKQMQQMKRQRTEFYFIRWAQKEAAEKDDKKNYDGICNWINTAATVHIHM